jgi:hypothetical protein
MYAVAVGGMFDGVNLYGPFDDFEDAEKWAAIECGYQTWIVKLLSPEEA